MTNELLMAAINRLLDVKDDVAGILSSDPKLALRVENHIVTAVDLLIKEAQSNARIDSALSPNPMDRPYMHRGGY